MGGCITRAVRRFFSNISDWDPPQDSEILHLTSPSSSSPSPQTEPKKILHIDESMSSPTMVISDDKRSVLGRGWGLALVGDKSIMDQSGSYWEWHVRGTSNDDVAMTEVMFGVSTKRNKSFYDILMKSESGASLMQRQCTKFMKKILNIQLDDTIGVALHLKTENPNIELWVNGHKEESFALVNLRSDVFPSIWLSPREAGHDSAINEGDGDDHDLCYFTFVNDENEFRQYSPSATYLPLGMASNGANGENV